MNQDELKTFITDNPNLTLEKVAQKFNISLLSVIMSLPNQKTVSAQYFDEIWSAVTSWGKVTFLVHTNDIILEYLGNLPEGYHKVGYFNLKHTHGLGGHIKADHCQAISFIERETPQFSSACIIFLNKQGNAMVKLFVGRDQQRNLDSNQLAKFRQLAKRFN